MGKKTYAVEFKCYNCYHRFGMEVPKGVRKSVLEKNPCVRRVRLFN